MKSSALQDLDEKACENIIMKLFNEEYEDSKQLVNENSMILCENLYKHISIFVSQYTKEMLEYIYFIINRARGEKKNAVVEMMNYIKNYDCCALLLNTPNKITFALIAMYKEVKNDQLFNK